MFRDTDLDQLVKLEKRAFSVGPYSRTMLRRIFSMKGSFNIIAEEDGKILGYVSAIPIDGDTADVESIAVDPDLQRMGIGGVLLDRIEGEMRSRGFKRSILEVREKNTESINFYRKHGYEETGYMKTYYSEYYRGSRGAFRMTKLI